MIIISEIFVIKKKKNIIASQSLLKSFKPINIKRISKIYC